MFNIEGLTSLLGRVGQSAPSIFNSLNAGQTASNPYTQMYNQSQQRLPMQQQPQQNYFAPPQSEEIPIESFMPYPQEGGFNINSLFNRASGGQQTNPFNQFRLG